MPTTEHPGPMSTMTFEAFDAWIETQSQLLRDRASFNEAEHFEEERVQFHAGDLAVDEVMVAPVTVVDGDLTCTAITHDFDVGLLVVTGDLHVSYIDRMTIDIVVGGNLYAQSLCLNTLNDYLLCVGGDIVCDYFAESGCYVEAGGKIVCPTVLNTCNQVIAHGGIEGELIGKGDFEERTVLVADVLSADGYLDEDKFLAHVRAGRSPYRAKGSIDLC